MVNEENNKSTQGYQEELVNVSNDIVGIDRRLGELYDAIELGKLDLDDLIPRIRGLRSQQEQLLARKTEIEMHLSDKHIEIASLETIAECTDDLHDLLNGSSLAQRKAFVRSFVKDIKIIGSEATLIYTMPLIPDKPRKRKKEVLSIEQYGGRYWIRTSDLLRVKQAL